jgi:hypothetical protein
VFDHFLVGTEEEVFGQGLGLHARHINESLGELFFKILLSGAGHRGDEAALRKVVSLFNENFTYTLAIDLEPSDVTAAEDPAFEIHAIV